jgi:hypothetical protein
LSLFTTLKTKKTLVIFAINRFSYKALETQIEPNLKWIFFKAAVSANIAA